MATVDSRRHFMRLAAGGLLPGVVRSAGLVANESPFRQATAVWHMKGPEKFGVRIQGDVALGIPLTGAEYKDSVERGGDGTVAQFRGGHLVLGEGATLDFSGKRQMTLCLRVRDAENGWATPLLSLAGRQDKLSGILYATPANRQYLSYESVQRLRRGGAIEFLWRTKPLEQQVNPEYFSYELSKQYLANPDWVAGALRLQAPLDLVGTNGWHDVVVRFSGPNLHLFVDGVLVDEEWPYGALDHFRGPFLLGAGYREGSWQSGFNGQVDHLAFWDRALSDDEVAVISGGKAAADRHTTEFLGPEKPSLQYWRPRGFNTYIGDCMAAYYGGEFHLHYLFDRRHHHSKWGMGAHQFAHTSSKDLIHWTHHPMTVAITEQWECSIGTGGVIRHNGTDHAYYIQHQRRCWFKDAPTSADTVEEATSIDGINFAKAPHPVVPWTYLRRKDGHPGDINPDVFQPNPAHKDFCMSISGEKMYVSADLKVWSEAQGFDLYKDIGRGICGSYFSWNGWYYFLTDRGYRMSRQPMQPGWAWSEPEVSATHDGSVVPKIAPFGPSRFLMVGFLGGSAYAGEVVFREVIQHQDGTLGTKWPAEMIPRTRAGESLTFQALTGGVIRHKNSVHIGTREDLGFGMFTGVSPNVRITFDVKPGPDVSTFGICMRGEGAYERGFDLRFDPKGQRVQYGDAAKGAMAENAKNDFLSVSEIKQVGGLERPFHLDIIVQNDFVDTCIDNRRTFISRFSDQHQGNRLFFFAKGGDVAFEDIHITTLLS